MTRLAILLALLASPAYAQVPCMPDAEFPALVKREFGETKRGEGVGESQPTIYRLWISEATGTWTLTRTTPQGLACIIAAGKRWRWTEDDGAEPIGGGR